MVEIPRSIAEMFDTTARERWDAVALGVIDASELSWRSWSDLGDRAIQWMHRLLGFGYEIGEEVPVYPLKSSTSARSADWIACHLAMAWLDMAPVVTPTEMPQERRLKLLSERGVRWLHRPDEPWPQAPGDLPEFPPARPTSDMATVQFTSGTSGVPRGVMLSHENVITNTLAVAETIARSLDEDLRDEVRLSFLPFSHLFARVCDLYCWVYRGSKLVIAESRETIFRDCQLAKPTAINGVPYFFEKAIDLADRKKTPLKDLLGGEIRRCYSGGAALSPAVEQRFWDEGVPLLSGYGLSEASPVVTVSTIKDHKLGTVGKPLPGVEVRIADDGEVLVKGPNVMLGYWNDPEATAEALRDGWLHTGDLGELDREGFLTITGRKKELIVLSTGKNVAPSRVEARLCASPWIEQAAVVGDGRKGLGAVIVPNRDRVRAEIKRRRLWVWSKRRTLNHPAIREVFQSEIDAALADAPREERVHAFTLIPRAFDAERGEITAKLSLRRGVIERNLAREIGAMFG